MHVTEDLNDKENIGTFYEKKNQKTNQTDFTIAKTGRRKSNMLSGKVFIILIIAG